MYYFHIIGIMYDNMGITIVMDRTITILDNNDDDSHGYQIIVIRCD